jgi:hypothetical protein
MRRFFETANILRNNLAGDGASALQNVAAMWGRRDASGRGIRKRPVAMPRRPFLFLLSLLALLAFSARARVLAPTTLTTSLSHATAKVGTEREVAGQAKIQPHWHFYPTDFSDEAGPRVFTLTFTKSPAYALVGKPTFIG